MRKAWARICKCTAPRRTLKSSERTPRAATNHTAKPFIDKTGDVVDICDPFKRDWTLRNTNVGEVWGVGKRMKAHLESMGIKTAMDLAQADAWTLRQKFSVVTEKTARELAGTPCPELSEADLPKQEICCSRMFGSRLTEIEPIKQAVATYTRKKIRVSIRTGMFNPEEVKYANGALVDLPYPTNDVRLITKAVAEAVNRLFRPGYKYSKAEVLLVGLRQPSQFTDELFAPSTSEPAVHEKSLPVK